LAVDPGPRRVRPLALEDAAAAYDDAARTKTGMERMMAMMEGKGEKRPPFAPPFLKSADW